MPATVKGGFWEFNGVFSLDTAHTTSPMRRRISLYLGRKQQLALRETMRALNGVAPGGLANKTYSRVIASEELGGVRPIETEVLINRVTTTADRNDITADLLTLATKGYNPFPPPNLDGNPLGTR